MYVCMHACMHVCMHACIYIYLNTPNKIFQNHQISPSFSSTKISTFPASTTVAPWHSAASAAVAIDALGGVSAMRRPAKWGRHSAQQLSKVLWVTGTGTPGLPSGELT